MTRFGVQERRARLGLRHHLAPSARVEGADEVARDLVGLHGTDPASVYLAAAARMRTPAIATIERALYADRSLVRLLGMRRTVFVFPVELAGIVQAACADAIAVQERHRLIQLLEQQRIADDVPGWLQAVEQSTLSALTGRATATAAELAEDEPRLRTQLVMAEGKPYSASQSVSTRILFLLAAKGHIVRGRPRGSWISSQYEWSLIDRWLPGGLPEWTVEAAQVELVRRWLAAFGPAPLADLKWWTGLPAGQLKRALGRIGAVEVDLDGAPGLVLPDDLDPTPAPEPWAALLPALDPTVMGWSSRHWYLGEHAPALFDRSGNAGPTVWWDGRIVGGWAQRKDGDIVFRLLDDVGRDATAAVESAADRLRTLLGPTRVTPRFRTPLERELAT